jgi:hypothetical protein
MPGAYDDATSFCRRCAVDYVLFDIEAIDRLHLNLHQPRLQHGAGIEAFFVGHRGNRFASSALMAPMTAAFAVGIGARGLDPCASPMGVPKGTYWKYQRMLVADTLVVDGGSEASSNSYAEPVGRV